MHPDEHALVSDLILDERLRAARAPQDELAAWWARQGDRRRHEHAAAPGAGTPGERRHASA